jgi:hypothetical protein
MSGIVTSLNRGLHRLGSANAAGKSGLLPRRTSSCSAGILILQTSGARESCPRIRKTRQSSTADELSSFVQEPANHSIPIGRVS